MNALVLTLFVSFAIGMMAIVLFIDAAWRGEHGENDALEGLPFEDAHDGYVVSPKDAFNAFDSSNDLSQHGEDL